MAEARLEERRVVAPVLAGSTPVSHPGAIDGREVMVIGAASRAASSLFDSGRGRQKFKSSPRATGEAREMRAGVA